MGRRPTSPTRLKNGASTRPQSIRRRIASLFPAKTAGFTDGTLPAIRFPRSSHLVPDSANLMFPALSVPTEQSIHSTAALCLRSDRRAAPMSPSARRHLTSVHSSLVNQLLLRQPSAIPRLPALLLPVR